MYPYTKHLPDNYERCPDLPIDPPDEYWGPCEDCDDFSPTCHEDCELIEEEGDE